MIFETPINFRMNVVHTFSKYPKSWSTSPEYKSWNIIYIKTRIWFIPWIKFRTFIFFFILARYIISLIYSIIIWIKPNILLHTCTFDFNDSLFFFESTFHPNGLFCHVLCVLKIGRFIIRLFISFIYINNSIHNNKLLLIFR